jgi:hypothetical protein
VTRFAIRSIMSSMHEVHASHEAGQDATCGELRSNDGAERVGGAHKESDVEKNLTIGEAVAEMSREDLEALVLRTIEGEAKRAASRKRYMLAHKAERSAYSKLRQQKLKALVARAKELGLDKDLESEAASRDA